MIFDEADSDGDGLLTQAVIFMNESDLHFFLLQEPYIINHERKDMLSQSTSEAKHFLKSDLGL